MEKRVTRNFSYSAFSLPQDRRFKKAVVYLVFILIGVLTTYLFFNDGLFHGDDAHCHLAQCYDYYYGLKHGFLWPNSNHLIMGNYAYNMIETYAPLPHALVGLLYYLFEWAGANLFSSYKFVIVGASILGGIFGFEYLLDVTHRYLPSMLGGLIFVCAPVKAFLILCRASFSEVCALSFLPLFLQGIFEVANGPQDAKRPFSGYFKIIISISFIIYSHVLTGLMVVTYGVAYVIFLLPRFVSLYKRDPKQLIYTIAAIGATLLITLPYLLPALYASTSGVYRVGDAALFWTTRDLLVQSVKRAYVFTGLNIFSMSKNFSSSPYDFVSTSVSLGVFLLCVILVAAVDYFIRSYKKKALLAYGVDFLILLIGLLATMPRSEVIIAYVVFFLLLFVGIETSSLVNGRTASPNTKNLLLHLVFSLLMFGITLAYSFLGPLWNWVPEIYLKLQFSFRLFPYWTFFAGLVGAFACCFLKTDKAVSFVLASSVALCFVFNQASFEKSRYPSSYTSWSPSDCYGAHDGGLQKEYLPISILDDDYESSYDNSLLPIVRSEIESDHYSNDKAHYLLPVALTGHISTETLVDLNTPEAHLVITADTDSLIQTCQIYYTGYEVKAVSKSSKKSLTAVNVDGLLSFDLEAGTYDVYISYPGSKGVVAGRWLSFFTIVSLYCVSSFSYERGWLKEKRRFGFYETNSLTA
jgi:hypothetical protein